jgi:hypothetical protein
MISKPLPVTNTTMMKMFTTLLVNSLPFLTSAFPAFTRINLSPSCISEKKVKNFSYIIDSEAEG